MQTGPLPAKALTRCLSVVILAWALGTSGCMSTPVERWKADFDMLIGHLAALPEKGDDIADYGGFFRICEQLERCCADSRYAVDLLKDHVITANRLAVRGGAAEILGRIGKRDDSYPLIAALEDGSAFVREKAARALNRLTHETFGADRLKWLEWWKNKPADTPGGNETGPLDPRP